MNDGVQMQHIVPPRELKRFEQLKKAAAYLTNNKIDTLEQVEERIADLTQQIDWQTKHRIILNGQKKRTRAGTRPLSPSPRRSKTNCKKHSKFFQKPPSTSSNWSGKGCMLIWWR